MKKRKVLGKESDKMTILTIILFELLLLLRNN